MNFARIALISLAIVALSACADTCNDHAGDIGGPPPGCECLDNVLFGCGPFDSPSARNFSLASVGTSAQLSIERAGVNGVARTGVNELLAQSAKRISINLTKVASSCPNMRATISTKASMRRSKKALEIVIPSIGSSRLLEKKTKFHGNLRRAIESLPGCGVSIDLDLNRIPVANSMSSIKARGTVRCSVPAFSCTFSYRGTVARLR